MNVPEIRFKGFTDAWAQRKLGEVAEFSKGSGYSKSDLSDVGMPIILYGRLYTRYETVIEDIDTFVDPKENSVISCGGEIIVPSSGETAEDISRASVVGKKGIVLGGDLNIVRADSTINPTFLAFTISNGNQQKELTRRAQGKSVVHLNNSDLKEVMLQLPSFPEQTAIGNFFRTLDDTITLHRRRLEGLKELKKGYLQLMFPQAGESVPRVRFAGFTGEWERRVWGETVDISTNMVDPKTGKYDALPHVGPGNIESFTGRLLNNIKTVKEEKLISGKFYFNSGDIVYGKINPQLAKYFYSNFEGLCSADAYVLNSKEGFEQRFLYVLLQSKYFYDYSVSVSQRTGMPKINRDELSQFSFFAPNAEEQTAIGSVFRSLDEQITAQQINLDNIKQLKAAYLQKMFV